MASSVTSSIVSSYCHGVLVTLVVARSGAPLTEVTFLISNLAEHVHRYTDDSHYENGHEDGRSSMKAELRRLLD